MRLSEELKILSAIIFIIIISIVPDNSHCASDFIISDDSEKGIPGMSMLDVGPQLSSNAQLITDPSDGTIRLLKGNNLSMLLVNNSAYQNAVLKKNAGEVAIEFIHTYRKLFKIENPMLELAVDSIQTDNLNLTHVRLKQSYQGVRVWPADLNVHLNKQFDVYLIQGHYIPTPDNVEMNPKLLELDIIETVAVDLGMRKDELRLCSKELIVYCGASGSPARLSYKVYFGINTENAWNYVIDAHNGTILQKISAIQTPVVSPRP